MMKPLNYFYLAICLLTMAIFVLSCNKDKKITAPYETNFEISIAKWYQNHTAAITLAYDTGQPYLDRERRVTDKVLEYGLRMDFEIVGKNFEDRPQMRDYFLNYLIPLNFGYYGHGYTHINHDALPYDSAYTSFKLTYDIMKKYGLKPVAFAYPAGYGFEEETQRALKNAGFLCGRFHSRYDTDNPYILPDGEDDIENWYTIPSLVMQDYTVQQCTECVNNNAELVPILDEAVRKRAWIILTYHSIGYPYAYGYFQWDEFIKNLESITQHDFWNATMNNIVLYIKERQHVNTVAQKIINADGKVEKIKITLSDELPNDYYDQPLTLLFELPTDWINKNITITLEDSTIQNIQFSSQQGMISIKPDENTYELTIL